MATKQQAINAKALKGLVSTAKYKQHLGDYDKLKKAVDQHLANKDQHVANAMEIQQLYSDWATIDKVLSTQIITDDIYAKFIETEGITADNAFLVYLECAKAVVKELNADTAHLKELSADFVNTEKLEAEYAKVYDLLADYVTTDTLTATVANINQLFTAYVRSDDIVTGTLTAEQLFSLTGKFLSLITTNLSAENIETFNISSEHLTIADAFITDAMISSLSASKIVAGMINTSKVQLQSDDGHLVIADETIQIADENTVRVQIGKDASGDFNMYVWDADGNLMWNALGITADAIKDAIIVDDMVSEDANINASKLDISSIVHSINGGTDKLNSANILVDADNQTLSAWFSTMESWKSDTSSDLDIVQTQIEVINGALSSYITETEFHDLENKVASQETKYSSLEQTLNGFETRVGAAELKVDKASEDSLEAVEKSIKKVTYAYAASSSGTVTPSANLFGTDIPNVPEGQYLWTKTTTTFTNPTKYPDAISYSVLKQGSTGPKGDKGDAGDTGAGGNLIKNGYGEYLDTTGFTSGTFTRGDCPDGCYGYFNSILSDMIPFDVNATYIAEGYYRLHAGRTGTTYFSIVPYDVDGNIIRHHHVLTHNTYVFRLTKDLKPGDTVIYLNDVKKYITNGKYNLNLLVFGYTDNTGYTYPDGTYSREVYMNILTNNVDVTNGTIGLSKAWDGRTIPEGTAVGQSFEGSVYCYYGVSGTITNTDWRHFKSNVVANSSGKAEEIRLAYAKNIRIFTWSNVADYAKLSLIKVPYGVSEVLTLHRTSSSTTAPAAPTSGVSETAQVQNAWTTATPPYNATYPYYYLCTQTKLTDGTFKWSSVTRDRAVEQALTTATTASSTATQLKDSFNWIVQSGTDKSNMVLTPELYSLVANNIDLTGKVTFNSFDTTLQNKFDAADVSKIYVSGTTTIDGGKIATGTITADAINVNSLSAISANLGTVTAGIIQSKNYVANTSGMKLSLADGVWDSKNFKVAANGTVSISGAASISGNVYLTNGVHMFFPAEEASGKPARYSQIIKPGMISEASCVVAIGGWIFDHIESGSMICSGTINAVTLQQNGTNVMTVRGGWFTSNVGIPNDYWLKSKDKAGAGVNLIGINDSGNVHLGSYGLGKPTYIHGGNGKEYQLNFNAARFGPATDNNIALGYGSHRWKQLMAGTTAISTSDRNLKDNITPLTSVYLDLFMKLAPVSFTFKDGDSGRTHVGFISQDVEQAMSELGMSALDFAGFCRDRKMQEIVDENGDLKEEVPAVDEYGNPIYIYSLRYEEFIAIITYALQHTISVCNIRFDQLTERIAALEKVQ